MQRYIEIKVVNKNVDNVEFKVVKQSHFGIRFTPSGNSFYSRNGFRLISDDTGPRFSPVRNAFIFPDFKIQSNSVNVMRSDKFILMKSAIKEYNFKFLDVPMIINKSGTIKSKGRPEENMSEDDFIDDDDE